MLGFSTFVLTEDTDRWWAWTINVPMTAALLVVFSLALLLYAAWAWASAAWVARR